MGWQQACCPREIAGKGSVKRRPLYRSENLHMGAQIGNSDAPGRLRADGAYGVRVWSGRMSLGIWQIAQKLRFWFVKIAQLTK